MNDPGIFADFGIPVEHQTAAHIQGTANIPVSETVGYDICGPKVFPSTLSVHSFGI
jgi:hypothetical protein